MEKTPPRTSLTCLIGLFVGMTGVVWLFQGAVWAQGEVSSKIYRYRERVATGYYEGYELSPYPARARTRRPARKHAPSPFGSASAAVRIRARLPDAHRGLLFYNRKTCIECHPREARNIHSLRAGITCRQCHGPEPIPAIHHYYAAMNPIRRHAYVCAKCHEGANLLFASYHVHEPPVHSEESRKGFPLFYYTYWFMDLLLIGVLAFFLPHGAMVFLQELAMRKGKKGVDLLAFYVPKKYRERMQARFSGRVTSALDRVFSTGALGLLKGLSRIFLNKGKAGIRRLGFLGARLILGFLNERFLKKGRSDP